MTLYLEYPAGHLVLRGREAREEVSKSCDCGLWSQVHLHVNPGWPCTSYRVSQGCELPVIGGLQEALANCFLGISHQAESQVPLSSVCKRGTRLCVD